MREVPAGHRHALGVTCMHMHHIRCLPENLACSLKTSAMVGGRYGQILQKMSKQVLTQHKPIGVCGQQQGAVGRSSLIPPVRHR